MGLGRARVGDIFTSTGVFKGLGISYVATGYYETTDPGSTAWPGVCTLLCCSVLQKGECRETCCLFDVAPNEHSGCL